MAYSLDYEMLHEYDPGEAGITIPVVLSSGQRRVDVAANLDTGSTYCIFEREVGERLGLNIETGSPEWIGTPTGRFKAYGHEAALRALGFQLDGTVYFAEMPNFGRNVLGRYGWLQQLKLGLVDYEGKLYVGKYGDEVLV